MEGKLANSVCAPVLFTLPRNTVYPALLPLMPHTSAARSRLNWRPHRLADLNVLVRFARKTKSGFCACAVTFQTQSAGSFSRSQGGRVVALTGPLPRCFTPASLLCMRSHVMRWPTKPLVPYTVLCCVSPGLVERPSGECVSEPQCPHPCRCSDGIVDCQEKALTKVPDHLPDATTELWVQCLCQ